MATFVNDTFTDTDGVALTSHTGETGATWAAASWNGGTTPTIRSNRCSGNGNSGQNCVFYASGTPASADYTVAAVYVTHPGNLAGVGGRMATGAQTGYFALIFGVNLALYKYVAGTLTQLGTAKVHGFGNTLGTTINSTVSLTMSGTTISARMQRASDGFYLTSSATWDAAAQDAITATDAAISAAGKAGFWQGTAALTTTGITESFVGTDTSSGSSMTASPSTIPTGHSGNISIALTGVDTSWSAETFTVSGVTGVSKVSQTITDATHATVVVTTSSTAGTLTISDGTINTTVTVATATLSASPGSLSTSATTSVTLTGGSTLWSSETASGLFTVSGVSGCSISGDPTVTTNTSATISVITGASTGTLTITDTSTGATTTVSISSGPVTLGVTSTAIVWSPGNWYSDGAGSMAANNIKASSTYARTNCVGAYLRFRFTNPSSGDVKLNCDTANLTTIASGDRPILSVSVDGKAISTVQLTTISASAQFTLASSLAAGDHTIEVTWKSVNFVSSADAWVTPLYAVTVTGIELPASSTSASTPATRTKRMIVFGDSITEGAEALGVGTGIANGDGTQVWGALLGRALDAEVGIVGFSSQAFSGGGRGGVPAFSTSYSSYSSGLSRSWTNIDYVVMNMGKNGATTPVVTTVLSGIASAAPTSEIYVVPPFDRTNASTILAATLPANGTFVDLGTIPEYKGDTTGAWDSGLNHPNLRGHSNFAAMLAKKIQALLGGASAGSFGTFGGGRL